MIPGLSLPKDMTPYPLPLPEHEMRALFDELAKAAARETLPRFRQSLDITNKLTDGYDPVTEADRQGERTIRQIISERFPDHGVLGEEEGESKGTAPYRWVIDPVDGTRAYVCGVPTWTTLVGLEHEGELIAGMIEQPFLGERWIGVRGSTTHYRRREQVTDSRVSDCTKISDARMMVTDIREGEYLSADESQKILELSRACRLTRMGIDSYAFGLVASGQMDLVVESALNWHDVAGVIPVIEAAGGHVMGWAGEKITPNFHRGRIIIAATKKLADDARQFLQNR